MPIRLTLPFIVAGCLAVLRAVTDDTECMADFVLISFIILTRVVLPAVVLGLYNKDMGKGKLTFISVSLGSVNSLKTALLNVLK